MALKDIRKAVDENNAIIGAERVVKSLKRGEVKEVYLASNCPAEIANEVKYLAKLSECKVSKLNKTNEELGMFCRKPFFIAVLGIKKEVKTKTKARRK
ncbi:50S ribosomal protein L30 [Candidatus Woesearchaeota archaeon]|nr:ribosomal L7Ae/L30e/S12e/Gadd45 family protein [Candidatus Woesearchaeota archaeon]RLE40553.1 MAG: 50S ribosomal protein L30 [Candidatus Woesearchaeota archaeon]